MFSIFKSRRNKWRDEAKKLFDVYIVSLKGLDPDEIGDVLDLAKKLKSTMMEKLPPGEIHIRQAFLDPFGLPEDHSLTVMEVWHTRMRSAKPGEEAGVGALTIGGFPWHPQRLLSCEYMEKKCGLSWKEDFPILNSFNRRWTFLRG